MKKIDETSKLWDLEVISSSKKELLALLKNHLETGKGLLTVATPNPEQVVLSKSSPEFLTALKSMDVLLPDGVGLVLASQVVTRKTKQTQIKERIPGIEVVDIVCEWAGQEKWPVLVIGGRRYEEMGEFCKSATWVEGYTDASHPTEAEEAAVVAEIKKIQPKVVFIAFGAPKQELWLQRHQSLLEKSGVKLAMVVGGSFDVLLGKVPRAPEKMQKLGLEWAYRLYQEPWRWKRQLKLLDFVKLTAQETFK